MKTGRKGSRVMLRLLFLVYAAAMLWLLFGQRIGEDGVTLHFGINGDNLNVIPLKTVKLYWHLLQTSSNKRLILHAVVNLAGNVVLFIPLGWFLPYSWKKFRGFFKVAFLVIFTVFLVEAVQYFTALGSCDIDDLLLNLLGAMMGYCIWKIGAKRQSKS